MTQILLMSLSWTLEPSCNFTITLIPAAARWAATAQNPAFSVMGKKEHGLVISEPHRHYRPHVIARITTR